MGHACCHLGLLEDAMALLQTGKRLARATFRRKSIDWSDNSFSFFKSPISGQVGFTSQPPMPTTTDSNGVSQLIAHIKLLLRRKTAAIAALDAGLYGEAIRHFSKIVNARGGAPQPQGFMADCYMLRASAYRCAGRIAEAIADCNRTLALNPTCIKALHTRASLFETIRSLPDCLHDLEHLKLLYNSILRDGKVSGPVWKPQNVRYREIPGMLCTLAAKILQLERRVASGETGNADYYALMGLRRGCSRSELDRAHRLLTLRHKPKEATSFVDRCELADERDADSIRDRAKMSALQLYRLLHKGHAALTETIGDGEAAEKQRKKASAALQAAALQLHQQTHEQTKLEAGQLSTQSNTLTDVSNINRTENRAPVAAAASVFQGVFCRDVSAVGNLLSQAGFNAQIPVK